MNNTETRTYVYTSDEKDKAEKRKLRSVIMIAAGVLLLVVGMLLIVLAPALSDSKNIMPDVIGFDRDKAIAQLEKRGLEVDVIEAESDEYEAGVVIDQSIKPGEEIEPGMFIKLTVSVGNGGSASLFGSAPPMESADPDAEDTDGLERSKGGGSGGGSSGGGSGSNKPAQTPTPTKTPSVIPTNPPKPSTTPGSGSSGTSPVPSAVPSNPSSTDNPTTAPGSGESEDGKTEGGGTTDGNNGGTPGDNNQTTPGDNNQTSPDTNSEGNAGAGDLTDKKPG